VRRPPARAKAVISRARGATSGPLTEPIQIQAAVAAEASLRTGPGSVGGVPGYERQLSRFHGAFEAELGAIVQGLPLRPGMRVLDLACGDGFYTRRLAARLGAGGLVAGADLNLAYLARCRASAASASQPPGRAPACFVGAEVDRLPFPDATFDLVWCAQSLYSLPDAVAAVASMARVLRPGGLVAVLENDTLHQVVLPWPVALELSLRAAELRSLQAAGRGAGGAEVGRRLPAILAAAGLTPLPAVTCAFDRQAPLPPAEAALLQGYLEDVLARVAGHVEAPALQELLRLADPRSPEHLLLRPGLTMTWLSVLALGRKGPLAPGRP